MTKKLVFGLAICAGMVAFGKDIRVPTDESTLADAIAAAQDGDIIYLENGATYSCGSTIQKGVTIDGRGTATISAANTLTISHADTVLTGLTLTKAKSNDVGYKLVSGTIRDCTISGCENSTSGILTALDMSGGLLEDCLVRGNKGGNGSGANKKEGVVQITGNSTVRNVLFCDNLTALGPGAYNHTAAGAGCAYVCPAKGATVTFENCTFAGNTGSYVGGLAVGRPDVSCAGSVVLRNCVLAGNTSGYDFKTIGVDANCANDLTVYLGGTGSLAFENTFAGTAPTAVAAQEGLTVGAVGFVDERSGNYALLPGSPAYGFGARAQSRGDGFAVAVKVPAIDRAVGELAVTLEALLFNLPADAATYAWDLDGDGTYETTDRGASFEHVFTTPGWHRVGVRATVGGETVEQQAANLVYVAPTRIYMKTKGSATFPYDTEEKATQSAAEAMSAVLPGSIIEVVDSFTATATISDVGSFMGSNFQLVGQGQSVSAVKLSPSGFYNNVVISNLTVSGNDANQNFPLYLETGSKMADCTVGPFRYSTGGTPGGIYVGVSIDRCKFVGNYCNGDSAIFDFSGDSVVRNSVFTGNYFNGNAKSHLGIVKLDGTVVFENNTVYGNYAVANGAYDSMCAGIWIAGGKPVVRNSIVCNNKKDGTLETGSEANWYVAGGAPVIDTCLTPDAPEDAVDTITGDPVFADEATFTPSTDSPTFNAGKYLAWQKGATDFNGAVRYQGLKVDIGAAEAATPTPSVVLTADRTSGSGSLFVNFEAVNENAGEIALPPETAYVWAINGETVADADKATLAKGFDVGTYSVAVEIPGTPFGDEKKDWITVKAVAGVDFTAGIVRKPGYAFVSLEAHAVGGAEFDPAATYSWYRRLADGTYGDRPFAIGKSVTDTRFDPGVWYVKVVVSNSDGAGGVVEKEHVEADVVVEEATVDFTLSATGGEGRTPVMLTAVAAGFDFDEAAEFEWRWAKASGDAEPVLPTAACATGRVCSREFFPGVWTIELTVRKVDGTGLTCVALKPNALTIAEGADYYVVSNGDDGNDGTKGAPFATLAKAVEAADASGIEGVKKIKVTGLMKNCEGMLTLEDIELYGDGFATSSVATKDNNSELAFTLKGRTFVHDLKIAGARVDGGVLRVAATEPDVVVSNCWITGNWYSTGGTPAGTFAAGLVTHCLFTGNRNNNSKTTVLTLSGTATMRNSVFTGNEIRGNLRGPVNGVLEVSGDVLVENCTIVGNTTAATAVGDKEPEVSYHQHPRNGGGIYVTGGAPLFRNCIIRNNLKPHESPDGNYPTETDVDIYTPSEECDFYVLEGATPRFERCNAPEGQFPECAVVADHCQTDDPLFVDPTNTTPENRDFSLQAESPCRNAGCRSRHFKGQTDYAGQPRVMGGRVDIGAVEFVEAVFDIGLQILVR